MAQWITDIKPDAELQHWNSARGGALRFSHTVPNPSNTVPVVVFMAFGDVLTEGQQNALEQLLTDDTMDDATSIAYLAQVRALCKAVIVDGGIKAPAELVALPDKAWTFYAECRLRCDDAS